MTTFTNKELIKEIKERISSLEVRDDIERRAYEIALVSLEVEPDEREAYELFMEKRFGDLVDRRRAKNGDNELNRPGFPGECFICELRLPDHRFRWKH
uniref:hypothetical protein n=1 Tax=Escherichia coli TaxID=562 RepID=UPI00201AA70B